MQYSKHLQSVRMPYYVYNSMPSSVAQLLEQDKIYSELFSQIF